MDHSTISCLNAARALKLQPNLVRQGDTKGHVSKVSKITVTLTVSHGCPTIIPAIPEMLKISMPQGSVYDVIVILNSFIKIVNTIE